MDLTLTAANEQGAREVVEKNRDELERFTLDDNICYYGVKALVCFILSESINSKQE